MVKSRGSSLIESLAVPLRERANERAMPEWMSPMLATLASDPFSDPDWVYERKLDGERCLAFRDGRSLRLMSRNRKELGDTYPELVEALRKQDSTSFIVDGEVVAFSGNTTSFSRLQKRMKIRYEEEARASGVAVFYYIFDALFIDGHDVTSLPLRKRKRLLRNLVSWSSPLRFTPHRNEHGVAYLEEACEKGWEGLIAKDARAEYVHGRSRKWLKFKCVARQEFVIGGYTEPSGEGEGFGALLIGYYDDRALTYTYAGKVGTGYDRETRETLGGRLEALARKTPAFDAGDLPSKNVHWVTPKLVCEVGFTEWTNGKLRHPRFIGLRRDKDPKEVVRERTR